MSKTAKELKQECLDCDKEDDPFYEQIPERFTMQDKVQNKYQRLCKGASIDVYDVLKAFNVTNPATQHAIKKLLAGGERGYKTTQQDYHEAIASIYRAIELDDES